MTGTTRILPTLKSEVDMGIIKKLMSNGSKLSLFVYVSRGFYSVKSIFLAGHKYHISIIVFLRWIRKW